MLEDAVRNIVVVRGTSPMPVRDPLPLTLPKEVAEQAEAAHGDAGGAGRGAGAEAEDADSRPDRGGRAVPARTPNARRRRR